MSQTKINSFFNKKTKVEDEKVENPDEMEIEIKPEAQKTEISESSSEDSELLKLQVMKQKLKDELEKMPSSESESSPELPHASPKINQKSRSASRTPRSLIIAESDDEHQVSEETFPESEKTGKRKFPFQENLEEVTVKRSRLIDNVSSSLEVPVDFQSKKDENVTSSTVQGEEEEYTKKIEAEKLRQK